MTTSIWVRWVGGTGAVFTMPALGTRAWRPERPEGPTCRPQSSGPWWSIARLALSLPRPLPIPARPAPDLRPLAAPIAQCRLRDRPAGRGRPSCCIAWSGALLRWRRRTSGQPAVFVHRLGLRPTRPFTQPAHRHILLFRGHSPRLVLLAVSIPTWGVILMRSVSGIQAAEQRPKVGWDHSSHPVMLSISHPHAAGATIAKTACCAAWCAIACCHRRRTCRCAGRSMPG